MAKVAVCTVAYKEERFIADCVKQFKPYVDTHLVLVSKKSWQGNEEKDTTAEIATREGALVIEGSWPDEASQRNLGQMLLNDHDWILIVDADERYEPESIEEWLKFLEGAQGAAYGMGRVTTYWSDWKHRVDPEESPGLITAVRPDVLFTDLRCIDGHWASLPRSVVCHHGSYIRTDEEMLRKITNFGHAHELVPNWYEEKWLGWQKDPSTENLHPVHPEIFKRIVETEEIIK